MCEEDVFDVYEGEFFVLFCGGFWLVYRWSDFFCEWVVEFKGGIFCREGEVVVRS